MKNYMRFCAHLERNSLNISRGKNALKDVVFVIQCFFSVNLTVFEKNNIDFCAFIYDSITVGLILIRFYARLSCLSFLH
jgi:hypothetical protein